MKIRPYKLYLYPNITLYEKEIISYNGIVKSKDQIDMDIIGKTNEN